MFTVDLPSRSNVVITSVSPSYSASSALLNAGLYARAPLTPCYRSGAKMLTHSAAGDLEFGYESFELSTDPGLVMLVYTVEPGSETADAMRILASWTAPTIHATEPGTSQKR